ncbi:MAG: hypothetical protein KF901_12085 [Myxococcales bacterium]|nr:hypothetical protein [Myxococcales bacterium]
MNLATALLWAWVAVHVFSGLTAFFLLLRERKREHAAHVSLTLSVAAHAAGTALLLMAPDEAAAAAAQTWMYVSGGCVFVSYAALAEVFTGRPGPGFQRLLRTMLALFAVLCAAGVFVDPALAHRIGPSRGIEAHVLGATLAIGAVGVAFGIAFLVQLGLRRGAEARLLALAVGLTLLGWVADLSSRTLEVDLPRLTSHLSSMGVMVVSYLLLNRFVQTADALARRTVELAQSTDELRHIQEALVKKEQLAAVGELSAVIAHEVRNPLAVLKTAVAGLRRETIGANDRETLLGVLDEETDRLNRLVRDLLAYARPVEPQWSRLPVRQLVDRAVDLARRDQQSLVGVEVEVEVNASGGEVIEGDPDLLERVFAHLVQNALQAMPHGGRLLVQTASTTLDAEPAMAVRFQDTGEGMDTLVRSRARDPFFTTKARGTGLGLAIVERIVKAHGGLLDLKSGEEGSEVTLTIPQGRVSVLPEQ